MSKKFAVSSVPKAATPAYDAGDRSVKAKGFQLTETTKGVDLPEPDRRYSFSKINTGGTKSFLHPPDRLIVGRVIFKAKYLGYLMVKEPKGTPIVKAAVDKIKIAADVRKTNEKDFTLPEVELCISIRALSTVDQKTRDTIVQHSLPLVSFSADLRRDKKETFTYIAKTSPKAKEYVCYAYEVPRGQGKQISATVSQAFELAYRKYQEAKDIQTQFMDLKKKLKNAPPEEKEKVKKEIAALEAKSLAEEERLQRAREQIKSEAVERGLQPPATRKTPSKPTTIKETVVEAAVEEPKQEPPPPPKPEPVQQPPEQTPEKPAPQQPPEQTPEKPAPEQPIVAPPTTTTESTGQKEADADAGSNGSGEEEAEVVVEAEVEVTPAPPPVWKRGFDIALNTLEQQIKELEEAFEWRREMERKQRSLLGKDDSDQYLESKMAKMPGGQ